MIDSGVKRVVIAICLTGTLFLTMSCGIDSFAFLSAPSSEFVVEPILGETDFVFKHNTSNSGPDFLGYELYYKFYTTDQESDLNTDKASIEGAEVPGTSVLISRGYKRIARPLGQRPAIEVTPAEKPLVFIITIDMSVDPNPSVTFDLYGVPELSDLIREVIEEGESDPIDKGFLGTDIIEGDNDVPAEYLNGLAIDIAVFVIAYGIDAEDLIEIYSNPTYLGYVRI